jgi:hypothetical protein
MVSVLGVPVVLEQKASILYNRVILLRLSGQSSIQSRNPQLKKPVVERNLFYQKHSTLTVWKIT